MDGSDRSERDRMTPTASWPEQSLPRGGAIGEFTRVRQKHDSVHHSSKGKCQRVEKLTADSPRRSVRAEKNEEVLAAVEIGRGHGEIQKLEVWDG